MGTISRHSVKLHWRSSQLRYAVAYILVTTAVLVFLNIYASVSMRRMIFSSQRDSMKEKATLMSATLLQSDDLTAAKAESAVHSLGDLRTTRTVVTDAGGTALYDSLEQGSGKLLLFPEIVEALENTDVFFCRYRSGAVESRVAMPLVRAGKILGAVYLMTYDTDQGGLIHALQTNFLRVSVALEIAVIVYSLFFSSAFSRRMRRILYSVRMMREGDYGYKIELRGHDEMEQLGRAFNDLAERLEESEARRRRFVSDASHELKTPLASIKLLSDSILQNEMDAETQREFIGDIGREADRLGRLSQKLLMLTRLDSNVPEERDVLELSSTVVKVARMLRPLARLRQIRVETVLEKGCSILMVEDDLYQIVFNLAENAIKYNHEGGWVCLRMHRDDDEVTLRVEDNGAGIPEDARQHVFERFYRVDKARSRAAGGSGLGLSIVHDMVKRNFGTIRVDAREGGGTVFTVTFPLFEVKE